MIVEQPEALDAVLDEFIAGAHAKGLFDSFVVAADASARRMHNAAARNEMKKFEATINLDGVLEVEVTRSVSDSTIARMIRLVTEAQAARAPSERFSEWFGQRYTVAVLAGAVIAFATFWWLGGDWELALYRAATLLVAASPCAIVISVPAAILSALSAAARGGVLFKGGGALETLAEVDIFAFDKTGTLTTGRAEMTEIVALDGDEAGFLSLLAGLEAHSEHHIAAAIRREYHWVPDDIYRAHRSAFLQSMLTKPRIFATELMHDHLDQRARENMARELASLQTA